MENCRLIDQYILLERKENEMTRRELIEYFKSCKEHYPKSDDFVKKYQQDKDKAPKDYNGYIKKAYNLGMEINAEKAEPNQKWHLLISYYQINKIDINDKAYDNNVTIWSMGNKETGKGGSGLKCPELLLWIAEAAGCDITEAKNASEELCKKGKRLLACNAIKEKISWQEVQDKILRNNLDNVFENR